MASSLSTTIIAFYLVATAASAAMSPTAAPSAPSAVPANLHEACQHTTSHYDLCVAALSTDPASKTADTRGLAQVAITLAQENATETATYLSRIYDFENLEDKSVELQQCLEDCEERYEAAVEQLSDALTALERGAFNESSVLVAASQAEVKLCQRGCQAVPGHKNVLTKRNRDVDRLCSVALAITKLLRR